MPTGTDRSTASRAPCARGRCRSPAPAVAAASGPAAPGVARRPGGCWARWTPAAPTAACPPPTPCTQKHREGG